MKDIETKLYQESHTKDILNIEKSSFEFPWTIEEFLYYLKKPKNYKIFPKGAGLVAESNEIVVGYIIYEELDNSLKIVNVAVQESQRKLGVFTQLMNKVSLVAIHKDKKTIVLDVRETNLQAQLVFRAYGFKATKMLKNHYNDYETDEDAYRMVFKPERKISPVH